MEARGQQGSQSLTALSKSHRRQGLHPLGIAVWVKSTDSGYLVTVDFSLFLPRTYRWNLSAIENYKFDLWSFHWAELRPLTKAIKRLPNCKHLTTIIYLLHTAVFTILEQGLTRTKTTFVYTELPYHCR